MHQGMIEAQVSAGCVLFMHSACTAQQKSDTADCVLYTQLAASKKHSRLTTTAAWSDTWLAAFTRFGWALNTHEVFSCSAVDLGPGSVWAWLKRMSPAFMSRDLLFESESTAWQSLSSHPNQPAIELLGSETLEPMVEADGTPGAVQGGQKVVLQFGFLDAAGELSMVIITFTTYGPLLKDDFIFEPLQPEHIVGNVELRFYSLRLLERVYRPLRPKVSLALADRRPVLVCALRGAGDVH